MMLPIHGPRARLSTLCALTASTLLPTTVLAATEYVQKNITDPFGYKLLPAVSSIPAPLRVAPDQSFSGIDGSWNTFTINVGDPQALVQVYASTASQQIWVVNREACIPAIVDPEADNTTESHLVNSDCETSRGYLYNNTASKTWVEKGFYALWLEKNIGYGGANGLFGFDSLELGIRGEKGPYVQNTTVGSLVSDKFWLGHIGLHPKPTNFSAFEAPVPSYMTTLFDQKNIPSLSFGYTAGARYHGPTVLASLTLGGYDRSRIIPNDLTFIMAPNNERDLVVGVAGLTANTSQSSNINLLKRDDLNMFIDSTIAEIWLPTEICDAFAEAFGLKFDKTTELYLVDDTLHQTLLAQNLSVTFTLGQKYSTDSTVQITLPYAAFDLEASPPYRGLTKKTKYFPIRRGNDTDQWILGRTFLQEAYITVDWERSNFSLSAVDWNFKNQPDLLPIVSPKYAEVHFENPKGSGTSLAPGAVIGIAVGCGFTFALVLCAVGWWYWRRRHQRKLAALEERYQVEAAEAAAKKKIDPENPDEPPLSPVPEDVKTNVFPKAELPGDSGTHFEIGSDVKDKDRLPTINEADNNEPQIFEMPGDMPERQEAGGRQLSEKETMVVRERIYNGIDPNGEPEISPVNEDPYRRLAPISPSEVTMVNGRIPSSPGSNISPVTPRSPRDGAFLEATDTFFQLPPYRPPREGRSPEDTLLSPISPLEGSTDTSRRRFSYES